MNRGLVKRVERNYEALFDNTRRACEDSDDIGLRQYLERFGIIQRNLQGDLFSLRSSIITSSQALSCVRTNCVPTVRFRKKMDSIWQRGTNENTNGLLRQYLPKGYDVAKCSGEKLQRVTVSLNTGLRKSLDWEAPLEAFSHKVLHLI